MPLKHDIYTFSLFSQQSSVIHGVSTRFWGTFTMRTQNGNDNANRFFQTLGIQESRCVFMKQVHGSLVAVITDEKNTLVSAVDGLVTDKRGLSLTVLTADCLPLVLYDQEQHVIGVAHAGYKGILSGIDRKLVEVFVTAYRSNPHDILVGIGPSIRSCCYDIHEERQEQFRKQFPEYERSMFRFEANKTYLNLQSIVLHNFLSFGIKKRNIEVSEVCTSCRNDVFFSLRAERQDVGVFGTVIALV